MTREDYHFAVSANVTAKEAFEKISRVSDWWTKSFMGESKELGDTFSVHFGDTFVDFKIVEAVPETKIVWEVTDSNLHWLKDRVEWNNTRVV